jgi:hypothetical protein
MLLFFIPSLRKIYSALTETKHANEYFENLNQIDFILETKRGYESWDQIGSFDEKINFKKISCKCMYLEINCLLFLVLVYSVILLICPLVFSLVIGLGLINLQGP